MGLLHDPALDAWAEDWGPLTRQPLRIELTCDTAIAGYDPPHLDGLLAYATMAQATRGGGVPPSAIPYWLPLPLAPVWYDPTGLPLWAATDFHPCGLTRPGVSTWHRYRVPWETRINEGPTRTLQIRLPTTLASYWEAFCVGDADRVADGLRFFAHLGKKRTQGFGAIASFTITPIATFPWVAADGRLLRPMPGAALRNPPPLDYERVGWTAPYWLPAAQRLGLPAGYVIPDPVCLPEVPCYA